MTTSSIIDALEIYCTFKNMYICHNIFANNLIGYNILYSKTVKIYSLKNNINSNNFGLNEY